MSNITNTSDVKRPRSVQLDSVPSKVKVHNRQSLDVNISSHRMTDIPLRQTSSFGAGGRLNGSLSTVSVIDEEKELEIPRQDDGRFERRNNNSSINSGHVKNPYRKTSRSDRPVSVNSGNVNNGYSSSRPSSIYGGSVNSLPIVHEQYCSCTRWSKLEKTLITIVGILAIVVVVLIVTVGFLAPDKNQQPKHPWVF